MIFGIFFILCLAFATPASAWWNDSWGYRKKISLDTSPSGADIKANLTDVTVLIRLHSGNLNFSNVREQGEDLRFVDSSDTRVLEHSIESYNPLEEIAFVWVKVPVLSGSSKQHIWMYYGNPDVPAVSYKDKIFDADYVGVYHFDEPEGPPHDNTAYGNDASEYSVGQGLPAFIGSGVTFNGSGDQVIIPFKPSIDFFKGITFSAWIKLSGPVSDGYIFADRGGNSFVVGVDGINLYSRIATTDGQWISTERSAQIPVNSWHHIAVSVEPGKRINLYLDGHQVAAAQVPGSLTQMKSDLVIGSSGQNSHFFAGEIDEARISKMPRSEQWIRAMYFSQGPEEGFIGQEAEEVSEGGSGAIFLLGVIFKNITLDGWFIIGILMILGMMSMLVLLTKIMYLRFTARENREFIEEFDKTYENPISLYSENSDFQNSTLYSIYKEGCHNLIGWIEHLEAKAFESTMMTKAVNSMKSALERQYLLEVQKMNAWMVIMTLAISGGPFLGLLGTVWGVMNTFAAMSLAGEANLMAIAPGVASALATTVFGLIVAIPSLFGYNYLLTNIKNITADMNIFVDQFTFRVEEMIYKG
jgi:biopolymer transport protein ExbB